MFVMATFKEVDLKLNSGDSWSTAYVSSALRSAQSAGKQSRLWTALIATLIIHVAFFATGINLLGNTYVTSAGNVLTPEATSGVELWLAGLVAGPLSLGYALVTLAQLRYRVGSQLTATIAASIALACFGFAAWAMDILVQPENTFVVPQPDTLRQFLGGFAVCVYIPMGLLAACLTAMQCHAPKFKRDTISEEPQATCCGRLAPAGTFREHQPDSLSANWRGIWDTSVVIVLVAFATMFLSSVWNYSTTSYVQAFSVWSLLPGTWYFTLNNADGAGKQVVIVPKLYLDIVVYFSVILSWLFLGALGTYYTPGRRWAHRLVKVEAKAVAASLFSLGPGGPLGIISALVTFPFRLAYGLVVLVWYIPSVLPLPASISLFPEGVHNGEAFILSTFWGLAGWWFWWWSTGYTRIRDEVRNDNDFYANLHVFARVMGHMTTFFMSFLTFPVTRGSVWENAMGIPFDRAVKYHRVVGRLAWLGVTGHALLWWVKWYLDGTLKTNITTITSLAVSNPSDGNCPSGNCVHGDNFTIPLVELAWLLLTIALVFANVSRRASYELFQYTHIAAVFFMVSAVVHAWSHWYYTAVGLLLWTFNKIARTIRASKPVKVHHLSHAGGVTRLVLDAASLCSGSRGGDGLYNGHYAGQYAWISIPGISSFQWHPFTIASSPSLAAGVGSSILENQRSAQSIKPGMVELSIKDQGEGTWTHSLAQVAAAHAEQVRDAEQTGKGAKMPDLRDLCVSVDGPYGRPGRYYDSSVLVLVAGGIGFTPVHAILQDLLLRAVAAVEANRPLNAGQGGTDTPAQTAPLGHIRKVHVVWTVRDLDLPQAFASTLLAISDLPKTHNLLKNIFELHLHVTDGKKERKSRKKGKGEEGESLLSADAEGGEDSGALSASGFGPSPAGAGWVTMEAARTLKQQFSKGRPDLDSIFAAAAGEAERFTGDAAGRQSSGEGRMPETPLFASVCGPKSLNAAVTELAHKHSAGLHVEVFEF